MKLLIELVDFFIILISPNPISQPACLEKAQLIKYFTNHQTSVQCLNHLLKFCYNGIKLLLLQKRSTSFSWIKPAWKTTSTNNLNTKHCKCSVSSTSFSTCSRSLYSGLPVKNYETLHTLVSSAKLLGKVTKKLAEGKISRPLLRKVIYKMLLLLPIMQGLFWYCQRYLVKPQPIYHLFSLWANQFPLALAQTLSSGKTLILNRFQDFSLKKS